MLNRTIRAALAAIVAGAAAIGPAFAEEAQPTTVGNAPPSISVVNATVRPVTEHVSVTGTLVPREEVQVAADVDGLKVEAVLVDAGDRVEAGQVLARLASDAIDIQLAQNDSQLARAEAAIAQARSQIAEAEATAVEAEAALERTRTLADKGVVARDVLDQRVAAASGARARLGIAQEGLSVAEAEKRLIEAQRRELELRRSKTEVKAPAAGLVLERSARVGAIVSSATGPLFRIAEDGLIELNAEVIETELARVEAGQPVAVTVAGGRAVEGEVRLVSPEVDAATRLGHVRIALPADAPVRAGAFARGAIEVARREGVTVPVASVLTSGDTATVQVVAGSRIETREVETGLSSDGVVEIVEGLEAGETVVERAGTFLRDGDTITPVVRTAEETEG